jgi:CHASE3 domain sensor protein
MKIHVSRRTFIAFCIALSILFGLGRYAYVNSQRLIDAGRMVSHTNEVPYLAEQVLSAEVDIETSQRGYTITGDSTFLDPYFNSVKTIHKHIEDLLRVTSDNISQQRRIRHLKELIEEKNEFYLNALVFRNQSFEDSKNLILAMQKGILESIRQSILNIENVEKILLAECQEIGLAIVKRSYFLFHFTSIKFQSLWIDTL